MQLEKNVPTRAHVSPCSHLECDRNKNKKCIYSDLITVTPNNAVEHRPLGAPPYSLPFAKILLFVYIISAETQKNIIALDYAHQIRTHGMNSGLQKSNIHEFMENCIKKTKLDTFPKKEEK